MVFETVSWANGKVRILDQTKLPSELVYVDCPDVESVARAIESMKVRGAPAIGVTAAYGAVLGVDPDAGESWREGFEFSLSRLSSTRPTAVNLFWALRRMKDTALKLRGLGAPEARKLLLEEARRIHLEDREDCERMGMNGASLLEDGSTVLTHCNAGALATGGSGTALSVIYAAAKEGKRIRVYADETRPLLQGARLTAWELKQNGIDVTLICDNMAAYVMRQGRVDCVIVGADRIASNGDVANKIGTYSLAVLAKEHGIPLYVVAPLSTIDMNLSSGEEIPIEERSPDEVYAAFSRPQAPEGVSIYNPAFDVTPNHLVSAIISEKGIARRPYRESLSLWFEAGKS